MMGDGVIDFASIGRWVAAAGYAGPVEVEIFNAEIWAGDADEVLATMKERWPELVLPSLPQRGRPELPHHSRAPDDELWREAHGLVDVCPVFLECLDFVEQQLRGPAAEIATRLTDRGERHGGRGGERDVVVADDRDVIGNPEPVADETLQQRRWPTGRWPRRPRWAAPRSGSASQLSRGCRTPLSASRFGVEMVSSIRGAAERRAAASSAPHASVADLLQVARSADERDMAMTLLEQVLDREPPALDVVHRHRAEIRLVPCPVEQDDRDAAPPELADPVVNAPDRREQHTTYPLLLQQHQVSPFPAGLSGRCC